MPEATDPAAPLRIVLVEDSALDAELIGAELREAGYGDGELRRVETEADLEQELKSDPDVILCDYNLRGFSAVEALARVRARDDIPFIIVSGSIGEETAVNLIKQGADDYLLKDRLGRIGPAIAHAVEERKLRAAARRAEEDLRQSEFKYRTVFERVPEASYLCDATNGRIIDTNPRGESILGLTRASILGRRLNAFLPERAFRTLLSLPENTPAPGVELDSELTIAGGRQVPVHINATNLTIYSRRLLLTFLRDLGPPHD